MSVHVLASARTALESSRGTAVATATRLLYFTTATFTQDVATIEPLDSRGGYNRLYRAYPGVERDTFDIAAPVNFDDFTLIGQLAVGSAAAGTVTAGTAYSWQFTPSNTTDAQRTMTLEYSYLDLISTVGWRVPGLVCDELTINYDKASVVDYAAKFITAQGAAQITAFSGSLTDRAEVAATGPNWSCYIDTTTLGSTLDKDVLKAQFVVKNGYKIRDGADGTATGIEVVKAALREVTLKVTRYFDDKTELTPYLAKTPRLIRLKTTGGTITGGTAVYTHIVNFCGVANDHKIVESNGMGYAEINYQGYAGTAIAGTADYDISLINAIGTIS